MTFLFISGYMNLEKILWCFGFRKV